MAYLFFYGFMLLGYNAASAVGGRLGRWFGWMLPVTRKAQRNIEAAMPELGKEEVKQILRDMWDNLGRTFGEFPHIQKLAGERLHRYVTVENLDNMEDALSSGRGVICITGHFANWEIAPRAAYEYGHPLAVIYRPTANPWVEALVRQSRSKSHDGMFPKGREAARGIISQLKTGGNVGIMVDQKSNSGLPIEFFGRNAMTDPAVADFGKKFNVSLLPTQVIRHNKNHFRLVLHKPIETTEKSREEIMLEVNRLLEDWIRQHPSQWFWVHNRWPKD